MYFTSIYHFHLGFLDWKKKTKKLSMDFLMDWVAPKPCPSKDPLLVESYWSPISRCPRVRPKRKVERPEQAEAKVRGAVFKVTKCGRLEKSFIWYFYMFCLWLAGWTSGFEHGYISYFCGESHDVWLMTLMAPKKYGWENHCFFFFRVLQGVNYSNWYLKILPCLLNIYPPQK